MAGCSTIIAITFLSISQVNAGSNSGYVAKYVPQPHNACPAVELRTHCSTVINKCSSSTCGQEALCCLDPILNPVCVPVNRNYPQCSYRGKDHPSSSRLPSSAECLTNAAGCTDYYCSDGQSCCVDECNEPSCQEDHHVPDPNGYGASYNDHLQNHHQAPGHHHQSGHYVTYQQGQQGGYNEGLPSPAGGSGPKFTGGSGYRPHSYQQQQQDQSADSDSHKQQQAYQPNSGSYGTHQTNKMYPVRPNSENGSLQPSVFVGPQRHPSSYHQTSFTPNHQGNLNIAGPHSSFTGGISGGGGESHHHHPIHNVRPGDQSGASGPIASQLSGVYPVYPHAAMTFPLKGILSGLFGLIPAIQRLKHGQPTSQLGSPQPLSTPMGQRPPIVIHSLPLTPPAISPFGNWPHTPQSKPPEEDPITQPPSALAPLRPFEISNSANVNGNQQGFSTFAVTTTKPNDKDMAMMPMPVVEP